MHDDITSLQEGEGFARDAEQEDRAPGGRGDVPGRRQSGADDPRGENQAVPRHLVLNLLQAENAALVGGTASG